MYCTEVLISALVFRLPVVTKLIVLRCCAILAKECRKMTVQTSTAAATSLSVSLEEEQQEKEQEDKEHEDGDKECQEIIVSFFISGENYRGVRIGKKVVIAQ